MCNICVRRHIYMCNMCVRRHVYKCVRRHVYMCNMCVRRHVYMWEDKLNGCVHLECTERSNCSITSLFSS